MMTCPRRRRGGVGRIYGGNGLGKAEVLVRSNITGGRLSFFSFFFFLLLIWIRRFDTLGDLRLTC